MPRRKQISNRFVRGIRRTSIYSGPDTSIEAEPSYLFRQVIDPSVGILNRATRGIDTTNLVRIVDYFTLTLLYPEQLRYLHGRSRLRQKPALEELESELASFAVNALTKPVTAKIRGVGHYGGSLAVAVAYPEFDNDKSLIDEEAKRLLGFPTSYPGSAVVKDPHISVARGHLKPMRQVEHIKSRLPAEIHLSSAQCP